MFASLRKVPEARPIFPFEVSSQTGVSTTTANLCTPFQFVYSSMFVLLYSTPPESLKPPAHRLKREQSTMLQVCGENSGREDKRQWEQQQQSIHN